MTAPKLRPPCSGWIEDLPEPSCKPTVPLALDRNAPNHLDDIYLEVPRHSAGARGIYFWMGIAMALAGLSLSLLLLTDSSSLNFFEDFWVAASDILFLIIFGCLAAVYVRMDISVPRDLPLRFNRARQRLYAYNFIDSWWNPFRRWHAAPVTYDWCQVRAERWHKRAFTPQGALIVKEGVVLSIVEPGTNKVIERFPLSTMGADEFAWAYICTYMQQGPSALPPPDPPRDHTDVPWYKIGLRFAPEVKWPDDMDLESRTAP
ncbi:hypothetical protein N7373_25995 [Achromobacter mucicolens]|uniref:DUF6708 domain-containing protein n=1 Tax=Achromobacter mucicolens TaxID=1389922 RepID=UPI002448BD07|nr:DUF6708 domain-containing protein [Achromobacter mucicolens]MDH0094916.1 hypothetical protein [Achromobacter mucicolens]